MDVTNRLPALAAMLVIVCAPIATLCVAPGMAYAQAQPAAPAAAPEAAAPEAPKPATPTPPPPVAEKEVIENPYGLEALWKQGDFISRGTLIILVIMSMGSWYIMFVKVYEQMKLFRQAKVVQESFWSAGSVQEGTAVLKEGTAFRYIAESGIKATSHHEGKLLEQIDLNTWVTMSIQRAVENVSSRLQDGLAFLATVGSTAPFVGLFGTVWGIYHALTAIGIAGQASIDKVAGPVGEALIMTAFGLAVAVPAVLGYNWLVRRNKVALEYLRAFSADLHMVLMSGNARSAPAPRAATPVR
ncbi:MAG TPA: MotA/TolQ/ExbB proton channel family protein [Usitatibacter sp.]|nr:MotA/TolQ/ExbB proton channel family protein [Usitatibacter sp.]